MRIGLDIGSTTIKCVALDEKDEIIYNIYERHFSRIKEKTGEILQRVKEKFSDKEEIEIAISGSAGMGLASKCNLEFVQEVFATRIATKKYSKDTDVVIELGGEDAKILFLTGGEEVRMNGSCAGGTGAFIDQMATLLRLSVDEMDKAATKAEKTYTIASRCGVFAKTDVQPLINQGGKIEDIAKSIYEAVVNQTIAGLSQGRKIEGNVLYLGGPLAYSKSLRESFDKSLKTKGNLPENSLLYVALGTALHGGTHCKIDEIIKKLEEPSEKTMGTTVHEPLFKNHKEYEEFLNRHEKAKVEKKELDENTSKVHIGIDAGSTTLKIVVIDEDKNILYEKYQSNSGNPVRLVREVLQEIYTKAPNMKVISTTTTGYGEELIKKAFHGDYGVVETVAHFRAAKHFMPDVDFVIDIGGQDMKCFKVEGGEISDIFLNEACSSGCGSFLQTFANALGYEIEKFGKLGLFGDNPVELGSRCTVFMNSSVKQAQKEGATIENISAGLSISVVKNAIYKVIRATSPKDLGKKVVVQGGTFYNDAVLRAFEQEMGCEVIRPSISGLMGAFGAALYGLDKSRENQESTLLKLADLENFTHLVTNAKCGRCTNNCQLTINKFGDKSSFISGNKCDKPVSGKANDSKLNIYQYKRELLENYKPVEGTRGSIGIPLCLNMYDLMPFWYRFFTELGFSVHQSSPSNRKQYLKGQTTIPSDTVCFPAKLTHGHIKELSEMNLDAIFYPCMTYNVEEGLSENNYNCPVVA